VKAGPIFVVKLVTSFDNRDLHLGAIGEIDALVHDETPVRDVGTQGQRHDGDDTTRRELGSACRPAPSFLEPPRVSAARGSADRPHESMLFGARPAPGSIVL
jgi:hypothetical protein